MSIYYGNYGGKGHSGEDPVTNQPYKLDPIDNLDRAFKDHDISYDAIKELENELANLPPDTSQDYVRQLNRDILNMEIAADTNLLSAIERIKNNPQDNPLGIPPGSGVDQNGRSAADIMSKADKYFGLQIQQDRMMLKDYEKVKDTNILSKILDFLISDACASGFDAAGQHTRPFSPITLDLDGDGIETVAMVQQYAESNGEGFIPMYVPPSSPPIMFDHNGDGVKVNTGWIKSDDGMLVLDRNGNGTIDSGQELFGDNTLLYAGGKAADGFAAMTQEDTNTDGVLNNLDTNWNSLRIWQDLNQDGISQAGELSTLDQLGISSVNVAAASMTATTQNGNTIKGTGSYTKTDGTTQQMAEVWFDNDTFTSQFTDSIPIAADVALLPEVAGSGLVRDLQQAATLSPALQNLLTQYSAATTRQEQMALMGSLLDAWADTSGLAETMESRDPSATTTESLRWAA